MIRKLEIHKIEKSILKIFSDTNKFPLSSAYWLVQDIYPRSLSFYDYHRALKSLAAKKILNVHEDNKIKEPVYSLSEYGITLRNYLFPVLDPLATTKYTSVLVTPEKAAKETGVSLNSIKRKKVRHFHYLVVCQRLYVLKRVETVFLYEKVPNYPVITSIFELMHLFPKPPRKFLSVLDNMRAGEGWVWPEILLYLLNIAGRYIHPCKDKDKANNNKKIEKEVNNEEGRICMA